MAHVGLAPCWPSVPRCSRASGPSQLALDCFEPAGEISERSRVLVCRSGPLERYAGGPGQYGLAECLGLDTVCRQDVSVPTLCCGEPDDEVFATDVVVPKLHNGFERRSGREARRHREAGEERVVGLGQYRPWSVDFARGCRTAKCLNVDPLGEKETYGKVLAVVEEAPQEVEGGDLLPTGWGARSGTCSRP